MCIRDRDDLLDRRRMRAHAPGARHVADRAEPHPFAERLLVRVPLDELGRGIEHPVALEDLALVREVDRGEIELLARDVLPHVELGPVGDREHPHLLALADAAVVEVPELDVWQYVAREQLDLPAIYFAHEREVFERDGMLYAASDVVERYPHEETFAEWVRFRTVGDMSCTGGVRSRAATIDEVVREIAATRVTERGETRADDKVSEAAMEDRKRLGYF